MTYIESRQFEASIGSAVIALGALLAFMAVVGLIPTFKFGVSWIPVAIVGALAMMSSALGVWIWRRSKRADVRRIGPQLVLWGGYVPLGIIWAFQAVVERSWIHWIGVVLTMATANSFRRRFSQSRESE